jgi:serine/threonine-protein kinase
VGTQRDNPAIASAWARGQIRQIEDRYASGDGDRAALERAIVALSLEHHVLSRFTAYVAVDRSQAANRGGALHQVVQPVEMPQGWIGYEALGAARVECLSAPPESALHLGKVAGSLGIWARLALDRGRVECLREVGPEWEVNMTTATGDMMADARGIEDSRFSGEVRPRAGTLPDRLDVGEEIASGAMGRIYKAVDRTDGNPVLVKIVPHTHLNSERFARWQQQNELITQLNHPALCPALDMGSSADSFWLIMPYFPGQTLRKRLRSAGRIPFRQAAELVAELAEALQLAHDRGLVQGDLKSERIFLGADGQVRLLDFGELPLRTTDAGPGTLVGTPAYMAPERIQGEAGVCDSQAEVYSLGVVFYEMLTRELPFSGRSIADIFRAIRNEDPKRPRRLDRSIPAALEAICLKAMAKDRNVRYATAGELAAALRGFLAPARRKGFWKAK